MVIYYQPPAKHPPVDFPSMTHHSVKPVFPSPFHSVGCGACLASTPPQSAGSPLLPSPTDSPLPWQSHWNSNESSCPTSSPSPTLKAPSLATRFQSPRSPFVPSLLLSNPPGIQSSRLQVKPDCTDSLPKSHPTVLVSLTALWLYHTSLHSVN